ncbi:MAG: SPOR domain-containing protein [Burkholderiaceae bacterium]
MLTFFRRNKQETAAGDDSDGSIYSRAEDAAEPRPRRRQSAKSRQNKPTDPLLPEKKRARRRLVGAVTLVLALIVGLPMVFDAEPKPVGEDIAIQIPSRDPADRTAARRKPDGPDAPHASPMDADPSDGIIEPPPAVGTKPSQSVDAAPTAKPAAEPRKLVAETKAVAPEPKPASEPKTVASAQTPPKVRPPEVDRVSLTSGETASRKTEPKPSAPTSANERDTARALALLEGNPKKTAHAEERNAGDRGGKVVLQVAALSSPQKASELQHKLSGAGIHSYTQKVSTHAGERIRIRTGPYASREEAERVRAKLSTLGLSGSVVPN